VSDSDIGPTDSFRLTSAWTYYPRRGVRDFQDTIIGRIRIRDNEVLVPFGGRGILPIGPRLELFGGGGAAYLHYGESVEVPGGGADSSFKCQTCRSRGGWGAYATAGLNVAVERSHRFWVGVESRIFHGKTNGDPLGAVPPLETRDTWIDTAGPLNNSRGSVDRPEPRARASGPRRDRGTGIPSEPRQ
jgi:hypothetical protein